jgi:hypothetical protein
MNRWHLGEGGEFRRPWYAALAYNARSALSPSTDCGDWYYETWTGGERLAGFHHAFSRRELHRLFTAAGFQTGGRYVVGYNTGAFHTVSRRGQLLHAYRKPEVATW